MRNEKSLLTKEIEKHLRKSDYAFFTDFRGISVADVASIRKNLRAENGEFHVVKKTLLKKAAQEMNLPVADVDFDGQVAMVVGGNNPAGVAKVLKDFFDSTKSEKLAMLGGMLSGKLLAIDDIVALSKLPSMDILRSQLLSLLSTPASKLVRTLNAVPQGMLNVLQAKTKA